MQQATTTMHANILAYAELALREGNDAGINVYFDNDNYSSPEFCRSALVRFRNSFSALKARDRREAIRTNSLPFYDDLGCFVEKTPTGWLANIRKNQHLPSRVTKANGEPIRELTDNYKRFKTLQIQATMARSATCCFTQEDESFFWDYDPEMALRTYKDLGWKPPKGN